MSQRIILNHFLVSLELAKESMAAGFGFTKVIEQIQS